MKIYTNWLCSMRYSYYLCGVFKKEHRAKYTKMACD
nr:MAG TPA: hypothetical protein [Caudoviricetes sp.]